MCIVSSPLSKKATLLAVLSLSMTTTTDGFVVQKQQTTFNKASMISPQYAQQPSYGASSSTALQASFFDRIARVTKANVNNAIKNLEDPEKVMDQAMQDMQKDMIKIKQSYSELTATYRRMLKQKEQADSMASDWRQRAELAMTREREDLARQALERRQAYIEEAETLQLQVDAQAKSMDQLYQGMQLLEAKILEARSKKTALASRARKAKAIKKVNEMVNGLTAETNSLLGSVSGSNGAVNAFKRMEEKVEALEAAAEVSAEMTSLELVRNEDNLTLEQQFLMLEGSASVDRELEKLKTNLGKNALPASRASSKTIDYELEQLKTEKKSVKIPVKWE